jgi:23S rRNA-/tRNA-specific pseudouridylate synthase
MAVNPRKGKPARTEYSLLADFENAALLAVTPHSRRTDQIRLHLSSTGMPLLFDPKYSTDEPTYLSQIKPGYQHGKRPESPLIEDLSLHGYQISIDDYKGRKLTITAKPDKKFIACIKILSKYNPKGPDAFENPDSYNNIISGKPVDISNNGL